MEASLALKTSGNQHFTEGNWAAAIDDFKAALALSIPEGDEVTALRCALFSNLSMAYLKSKMYTESYEAAHQAVALNPSALKAWVRYVEARRLAGFPFHAFVTQLKHVRPLIREEVSSGRMGAAEASRILADSEQPLCRDVGIVNILEGLELVDYLNGVALVSRVEIKPNQVIFQEKQYSSIVDDDNSFVEGSTTVDMVQHYAAELRPHQEAKEKEWDMFKRQLFGAWPRELTDVSDVLKEAVEPPLREAYPGLDDDSFNELMQMSLICRFNGFQSGFFRTCALANHSCIANIAMKYRNATKTVDMLTVRHIHAGDFLHVKYLSDAHFLMGVGKRREYLRSWSFWCACDRCKEDLQKTAEVEQVGCPNCGHYVHIPFTPSAATPDEELLELCSVSCQSCGASLSDWSVKHEPLVTAFLREMTHTQSMASVPAFTTWIRRVMSMAHELKLNPAHWLYRVMLYFFCAPFSGVLESLISRMNSKSESQALADSILLPIGLYDRYICRVIEYTSSHPETAIFSQGLVDALPNEGCDVLNIFVLLWHHISPFYPMYELWALHKAICQLVILQLIYQPSSKTPSAVHRLSHEYAFTLLQRHAPYLGDDAAEVHLFNVHKSFSADPKSLPSTARIKKCFRR